MKKNTKSVWNATYDMKSGLIEKKLSWMCRWLLDTMWDGKSEGLMLGLRFSMFGSCVFITSKMWWTCHKPRKSNTWWEVSEMILACDHQLLKVDVWIKGFLCMMPWEKQPMDANQFFSIPKGTGQLNCTCRRFLNCWEKMHIYGRDLDWLRGIFVQFLGILADFCPDLFKFLAK